MTPPLSEARVVPAQLCFLTIYNPSLSKSDETFADQIVYHWSRITQDARPSSKNDTQLAQAAREAENEKLRQVGLAQGMVGFAATFSDGQPVDSIETDKSRVIVREIEDGWWALASIDLTKLARTRTRDDNAQASDSQDDWEYSSREVSPASLLTQQILSAYRTFILHHGISFTQILQRHGRDKLMTSLDRFWTRFCRTWEVLLHGNPAVTILGGLKLSAGGELGVGVGEEEWGSGEREVLEDMVHRTEGLMDMIVSRFGEDSTRGESAGYIRNAQEPAWLGSGHSPDATDGVVFGGIGAVSRKSVRDIACWIEQIYTFGDHAYGVKDNPQRKRRKMRGRFKTRTEPRDRSVEDTSTQPSVLDDPSREPSEAPPTSDNAKADTKQASHLPGLPVDLRPELHPRVASHDHAPGSPSVEQVLEPSARPGIPPPIMRAAENSLKNATAQLSRQQSSTQIDKKTEESPTASTFAMSDKWVKYLTLGLSTIGQQSAEQSPSQRPQPPSKQPSKLSIWSRATGRGPADVGTDDMQEVEPMPEGQREADLLAEQKQREQYGYFLIGYRGDLSQPAEERNTNDDAEDRPGNRLFLRTLYVNTIRKAGLDDNDLAISDGSSVSTFRPSRTIENRERARVIVYIKRPFIYAFLFEQRTDGLQIASFYKDLHHHLQPLHKPMSRSTSAVQVAQRLDEAHEAALVPESPKSGHTVKSSKSKSPVYDLLFDPVRLTVHSSIPNIPMPGTLAAEGLTTERSTTWTRIEGLNVHSHVLNAIESSRASPSEIERSTKTTRGWWVVFMRLAPSSAGQSHDRSSHTDLTSTALEYETNSCRFAILVRKSSDWTPPKTSMSAGSRVTSGMFGLGRSSADAVTGGASAGWGPAPVPGGVGFDARKYVEGLLSLNR